MDLQWINGTDDIPEMATKTNVNFNALQEGVGEDIIEVKAYADTVSATAKTEAIAETQTWAKGTFSNPNLLINGDFQIWQRGTSFATAVYTADRWFSGQNGVTITQEINTSNAPCTNSLKCVRTSTTANIYMYQPLENYENLIGKTMTLSFWIRGVGGFAGIAVARIGQYGYEYLDLTSEWQYIVITKTADFSTASWSKGVFFYTGSANYPDAGEGFELAGVKLELGSVATPFVPRPYSEELALCKQFYRPFFFTPQRITIYAPTYVLGYVEYDRSAMRANPVIVNGNAGNVGVGNVSVGIAIAGFEISLNVYHHWVRILATKSAHGLTDAIFTVTDSSLPLCYLDAEIY